MTREHDIVVVGAGVAGSVAARELAPDNDVALLESRSVAAEATGRSAGLIAPTLFYGDRPAVASHANKFFRDIDGTGQFELTERNRLDLVTDQETDEARETARQRRDAGFPVTYLDAATVRERYPQFRMNDFAGAIEYRDTGWVDPYSYAHALVDTARDRGATVETGTRVTGLVVDGDQIEGVETPDRQISADAVVIAAGWRTRQLVADHVRLPLLPYRTQCITLDPDSPLPEGFPLVRAGDAHLYMRPEHNGDLLVGGGREVLKDPESAGTELDAAFRRTVAQRVPEMLEGFDHAGVVNGWAGVACGTPDAYPIVDAPLEAPDGLVVATGFNGLGVMLSPVVGPLVRAQMTDETAPFSLSPFALSRFEDRTADFPLQSTSEV